MLLCFFCYVNLYPRDLLLSIRRQRQRCISDSVTDIPPIAFQQDFIYCSNPVTNLFAFTRPNKLPVFDAIANAVIDEGKPFNLGLKAVDPDGSTLVFSLVGGPVGLTVNPVGALSWTPGEEQGPGNNVVSVSVSP